MLVPSIFKETFMDDFFGDLFPTQLSFGREQYSQNLLHSDVLEFEDKYQLEIEVPGYRKEDIQAELKDGYLTINASHQEDNEEKDKKGKYIRKERYYGQCRRSYFVGNHITQDDIHAKFENGILKLEIPKKKESPEIEEKKYISIEG